MGRALLTAALLTLLASCSTSSFSPSLAGTVTPTVPDGMGTLALQEDAGDVWLLTGGEMPRRLTRGQSPLVSPDGCWIVVRREPVDYWLVLADGSGERRLFSPHDGWGDLIYTLVWTPDSRALLATTGSSIKHLPSGDLHRIEVPDGVVTTLATRDAGDPVVSPDGRWIATSLPWTGYTQGAVGLIEMDGTGQRLVFSRLLSQSLNWSADSHGLVVALARVDEAQPRSWELWWVMVSGEQDRLGTLSGADSLSWSPDSQRLAYQTAEAGPLHLAGRDGSREVTVRNSAGMAPWRGAWSDLAGASPWSPDGRWLLVSKIAANAPPAHYLVDTDLHASPRPLEVAWVHGWLDASHLLATLSAGPSRGLYRCTPDGGCQPLMGMVNLAGSSYTAARCTH
jgi:hypothetical protein